MTISSLRLVYFSPTGTTKTVLLKIALGLGIEISQDIDLTLPVCETKTFNFKDELVLIGVPVYAGRVPRHAVKRLRLLKGNSTPAVLVVLYGNREYEDALLELVDLSRELGFVPVSGAAFIGEHSFSTDEQPIAHGRPDIQDIETAVTYGKAVKDKLACLVSLEEIQSLKVPGEHPYIERKHSIAGTPATLTDLCTLCGICAEICPTGAIAIGASLVTDPELCIQCCACIKKCPYNARIMDIPAISKTIKWLYENYSKRKEPEVFF